MKNPMKKFIVFALMILTSPLMIFAAEPQWKSAISTLKPDQINSFGQWTKQGESISVNAVQWGRIDLGFEPAEEYDLKADFKRTSGINSIGFIFVHGGKQGTLEIDAWGENLAGIQNIDDKDCRTNASRKTDFVLKNQQEYTLLLQVRKNRIKASLGNRIVADLVNNGEGLSLIKGWEISGKKNLGLIAWNSATTFSNVSYRANSNPLVDASGVVVSKPQVPAGNQPQGDNPTMPNRPNGESGSTPAKKKNTVLIVIAQEDFFYREYSEPRKELENAGYKVVIASVSTNPARPHQNSGQGNDDGVVRPDIAIANVKAQDYDAILFSGGWGSSMYQYAFRGRYDNNVYNGNAQTKQQVNKLINDFIKAEKPTCALCNAVSVLAWARVNGKSPVDGKNISAPSRDAPPGIYNGQRANVACSWHPEQNGAKVSRPGSIGKPDTAEDDVTVDGIIVTGEDDISAREMGRTIVKLLDK